MVLTIICRLQECSRFTEFRDKSQAMTDAQIGELNTRTENKILEEMKNFYEQKLKQDLILTYAEPWEQCSRRLRPQSISQAVQAAKKDKAAPKNVRQPDPTEPSGASSKKAQDSAETLGFLAGQAAPAS